MISGQRGHFYKKTNLKKSIIKISFPLLLEPQPDKEQSSVTYFDKLPMRILGMSKSLKTNFDILFLNEET